MIAQHAARLLLSALLFTTAACSGPPTAPVFPVQTPSGIFKIKHIVWIMQENRSFDNLFQGYPGADTSSTGQDSSGRTIVLRPIPFTTGYDISHTSVAHFAACNGTGSIPGTDCRMNGFNLEQTYCSGRCPTNPQYGYVPHAETRPYFAMAHEYVLGDRMFASNVDMSYVSHQYMIAGQANRAVDFPGSAWHCGVPGDKIFTLTDKRVYGPQIPVCQNYRTLGDELDAAGLSWRLYSASKVSQWVGYGSIHHIRYGRAWNENVVGSSARVIVDVAHGKLADVTWVTPSYQNSDHNAFGSPTGPQWVSDVVNAIGKSRFWSSTAIFVMWDEWGGWYDHVKPPSLDFDGLGFRVPLLVISPYAKHGYVSHVRYEHGSILKFMEDRFGLPRLSAADTRANSPADDCFDFTQTPGKFRPFGKPLSVQEALRMERNESAEEPDAQ